MAKIIFHGHSFLEIQTNGKTILIDPFISGNPKCDIKVEDAKCNYIILTHGHGDHYGDCIEIAQKNDATIIATAELATIVGEKVKSHGMNLGGGYNFEFGRVKLTLAHHSSSTPDGRYAGDPAGVILTIEGKNIYHAGDTALFYDMRLIREACKIDYAFLPIGDNFTMGIDDAVKAVDFLNPKITIPIHYNTFPVITVDENEFKRKVESVFKKCQILNPGESIEF
ncbi:MAG: metal-dependent hydrolase [Ignavibacteria bacterium]|nr:metal-dependent hydrolase [Ignavibacteria bacterium]